MSEEITPVVSNDGGLNEGWTNAISEDIRGNEAFSKVGSINDLASGYLKSLQSPEYGMNEYRALFDKEALEEYAADLDKFENPTDIYKSFREAQKMATRKGDIPKPDADESEWQAFYQKLGKPDDHTGYELGKTEGVPEEYTSKIAEVAHKYNLSTKQAQGLYKDLVDYDLSKLSEIKTANEEMMNKRVQALDNEWGDAGDEMQAAVQALEKHFGMTEEQMDAIESNPETLILLGKIAKDFDERGQVGQVFNSTRQGLQIQIDEIEMDLIEMINTDPSNPRIGKLQENLKDLKMRTGEWAA